MRDAPSTREGVTHKVQIGGFTGFITVNEDAREIFIHDFGKLGSAMQGWSDAYAILLSRYWQSGASLHDLATSFVSKRFEPHGATDNEAIPSCWSLPDYILRYLALRWDDDVMKGILEMP